MAILAKGEAESEVPKATYDAYGSNCDVYLVELHRDNSTALYDNLKDHKIEEPKHYFGVVTAER
ncbi:hypothetical protein L4D06_12090 [Enterovibrio makurazakiensis]|uniref:Uncharacterized protein n=1 Tax=Enterovibrio gelatinilyticus TaxID=2899819 RepID=A0ABT5R6F7_9GAMM|nr:hypothetical protein [Enterovibrio sp. ZSDZ42]MDD1795841.1 hypothetical protein [Enterovibrio sp. ZSDZ42]